MISFSPIERFGPISHYEPQGIRMFSCGANCEVMYCTDPTSCFKDWVLYKHPDGQWVSLRKATDVDKNVFGIPLA
jgi:hypothetical protein